MVQFCAAKTMVKIKTDPTDYQKRLQLKANPADYQKSVVKLMIYYTFYYKKAHFALNCVVNWGFYYTFYYKRAFGALPSRLPHNKKTKSAPPWERTIKHHYVSLFIAFN